MLHRLNIILSDLQCSSDWKISQPSILKEQNMYYSGPFYFGVRAGKRSREQQINRENLAKKFKVDWEYVNLPGDGYKSWFSARNRGFPFDDQLAAEVLGELSTIEKKMGYE